MYMNKSVGTNDQKELEVSRTSTISSCGGVPEVVGKKVDGDGGTQTETPDVDIKTSPQRHLGTVA